MPGEICDLTVRVVAVELGQKNNGAMIQDMRKEHTSLIASLNTRLGKEEDMRWKMAVSLIGLLFTTCVGLIAVIYGGMI